jgi:hypothetical protein
MRRAVGRMESYYGKPESKSAENVVPLRAALVVLVADKPAELNWTNRRGAAGDITGGKCSTAKNRRLSLPSIGDDQA